MSLKTCWLHYRILFILVVGAYICFINSFLQILLVGDKKPHVQMQLRLPFGKLLSLQKKPLEKNSSAVLCSESVF